MCPIRIMQCNCHWSFSKLSAFRLSSIDVLTWFQHNKNIQCLQRCANNKEHWKVAAKNYKWLALNTKRPWSYRHGYSRVASTGSLTAGGLVLGSKNELTAQKLLTYGSSKTPDGIIQFLSPSSIGFLHPLSPELRVARQKLNKVGLPFGNFFYSIFFLRH